MGGDNVTPRAHSGLTYPTTRARDPLSALGSRYVSSNVSLCFDMYPECILCVMYLRAKIHCILNVS